MFSKSLKSALAVALCFTIFNISSAEESVAVVSGNRNFGEDSTPTAKEFSAEDNNTNQIKTVIYNTTEELEKNPRNTLALAIRGNAYKYLNELNKAAADYTSIIAINPNIADAYYQKGVIMDMMGKTEDARNLFTEALNRKPDHYVALYERAHINLFTFDNYESAVTDFTRLIAAKPNVPSGYRERALCYYYMDQFDSAIEDYNKAMELNPNDASLYQFRGAAYLKKKSYEQGLADLDKAILMDPGYHMPYVIRSRFYYEQKKYEESLKDCLKAIELKPSDNGCRNELSYIYMKMKQLDKALDNINKLIEDTSGFPDYVDSRGEIYEEMGEYEKALADYNAAFKKYDVNKNKKEYEITKEHIDRVKAKMK